MAISVDSLSTPTYAALGVAAFLYVQSRMRYAVYDSIPAVGYSFPLLSYITALQFIVSPKTLLEEGYTKYRDGVFKIPFFNSWRVVVSGRKLIDELRKAKDDELSFTEAVADDIQQRYTMGEETIVNPYHIPLVRNELTKNIKTILPDVHDELESCFSDILPATDDWTSYTAMEKVLQIVARISSRVFVGLPVCRNREYLDVSIDYTIKVVVGGKLLHLFPSFLRGLASRMITSRWASVNRVLKHITPVIEERRRNMEMYGRDWADKPNDMLQWLMDTAEGEEQSPAALAQRLLVLNFAAIHTSSMSFTTSLYRMAMNPEYVKVLRDEIEAVIAEEGWTKSSLQKMRKVDSFIKECQRLHGFSVLNMDRKALKDFTFSDGTFIPKGTFVCVASHATHTEGDYYDDPFVFDPWRFARMREGEGEATKQMATTASVDYVPFGLGRHACPGRFFAVAELKMMLAHLVLNYDVKMDGEGAFPEPTYFQQQSPPNRSAKVMFRKRRSS